jgi:hypothetical protein
MKTTLSFLTLLLLPLFAAAQSGQTISGTISDDAGKAPLANILVRIGPDTALHAITDARGQFRIDGVPLGRQSLQATAPGYEDMTLPDIVVTAGKEVVLNLSLRERLHGLQEVQVSAGRARSRSNNEMAQISARSFNADETKRYAGALGDPSRMAASFAGVVAGDDSRNDIVVRGNSPAGMLWQLEGLNIPNPNHYGSLASTGGPVSMLNNNTIGRSDFLTSAFPAQYGNATAGVFDIRLREGNHKQREAVVQAGFNGFEAGLEGPLGVAGKASYLLNYRYSTLGLLQKIGVDFGTGGATPLYQDLNYKITAQIGKKGRLSAFGINGISSADFLGKDMDTTQTNLYGGDPYSNSRSKYSTTINGISYEHQLSQKINARVTIGHSSTSEQYTYDSVSYVDGREIRRAASKSTTSKLSLIGALNHKIDARNSLQAGLSYDQTRFDLADRELFPNEPEKVNTDQRGNMGLAQAYAQYRFRYNEALSLVGGLHGQYLSLNNSAAIEPRVSARYALTQRHAVTMGYGYHSQAQNIYTYFTNTPGIGYTNKELGFTRSQHLVAGYEWMIRSGLRFKSELYYQQLSNVPVERRSTSYSVLNSGISFGADYVDSLRNGGSGQNYGIDLTLERSFSKGYYFLITGSLFESGYKGSDGIGRSTAYSSGHVLNVLAGKELRLGKSGSVLGLSLKVTNIGGRRLTPLDLARSAAEGRSVYDIERAFTEQQPDYFRSDLKLSYRKEFRHSSLEIALDLQNLTNNKNIFSQTYDKRTNKIVTNYQQGFFPVPMLRYTF